MNKTLLLITLLLSAAFFNLTAAEITLENYILLVEKNSRQLMTAAKDVEVAGSNEKAAKSQVYPQIGAQAGYTRNLTDIEQSYPVASDPASGMLVYKDLDSNYDNEYSFGLSLSQELFNMKVFNAIKASREYKLMSSDIYDIHRQAVVTIAKKLYYQNFLLEKLLEVKMNMEKNTHENYLNVKNKFDNGLVSQFDLLRAEVDWKMKIPETTQALKNLGLARINFNNLAGIAPEEEVILDCDISDYPGIPLFLPLDDILSERPDHKVLMREIALRGINVKAAQADHYPTVKANILYAVTNLRDTSLDDYDATAAQIGITVSLPIFTGGALSSQDEKARLELEQAGIRLKHLKENINSEVNSIYLALKETYERIESASATKETAQKAFEIAKSSYRNGMATQLDLKDATVSLELAEINHISAVYEYLSSYFDWENAIGKAALE